MAFAQRVRAFLLDAPKFHLVVIVVLVLGVIGLQVSRMVTVSRLESELADQRVTMRAESKTALEGQTADLLRLSATPLGWAIRSAMLANAYADIDAYLEKLVQSKYVKRVALVDREGKIIATTNLKLKGELATIAFAGADFSANEPVVSQVPDATRVIVPINDFTKRIGTLIFDYSNESITSRLGSP